MFDKLKSMFSGVFTFIGRKLLITILGPVLSGILLALNAMLPESAQLTGDQITSIIEWIIGATVACVAAQGTHDTVKGSSTAGTSTNTTQTSTTVTSPETYDPTSQ